MTKKETLYMTYLQGENIINALNDKEQKKIDKDDVAFKKKAASYKIKDLEDMLSRQVFRHDKALNDFKIRKFYKTPEGIEYKEKLDEERDGIERELEELRSSFGSKLKGLFDGYKDFAVSAFLSTPYTTITIEAYEKHRFFVDYNNKERRLSANIFSLSNICLDGEDKGKNKTFCVQLGAFMRDEALHEKIKNLLIDCNVLLRPLLDRYYDVCKREKCPDISDEELAEYLKLV